MMMRNSGHTAALMVLALALFGMAGPVNAHETEPARAEVRVAPDGRLSLALTLDVARYLSGADPAHKSTMRGQAGDRYRVLRSMTPEDLAGAIRDSMAMNSTAIVATKAGDNVPLRVVSSDVPPTGNTRRARRSTVVQSTTAAVTEAVTITFAERIGDVIVRIVPASSGKAKTVFLEAGERLGPIRVHAAGL